MSLSINIILLVLMLLAAVWTVMTHVLLRSAIGLAIVSALVSILMFQLNSPLAAVFELSVCTGLISVIFISTISLTQRLPYKEYLDLQRSRTKRFLALPALLVLLGVVLIVLHRGPGVTLPPAEATPSTARTILWNLRQFDLTGQILILLAGVYGVVILFKENARKRVEK